MNAKLKIVLMSMMATMLLPLSNVAKAGSTASSIGVASDVVANCSVSNVVDIDLGNYDPTSSSPTQGQGTFDVTCTQGTAAVITLGTGANFDSGSNRATDGTHFLSYGLYTDSGRNTAWDDDPGVSIASATGIAESQTVYTKAVPNQNVPAGHYTDNVAITVTF